MSPAFDYPYAPEPLPARAIDAALRDQLGDVFYFQQIDSTNNYALQAVKQATKPAQFSVIIAREQLAGRGRQGKAWQSGRHQGVYISVIYHHQGSLQALPPLSLVTGMAVADTFATLCPDRDYGLKWPNDLLTPQGKLAGILLESHIANRSNSAWVIGVGMNLLSASSTPDYPKTSLVEQGFVSAAKIGQSSLHARTNAAHNAADLAIDEASYWTVINTYLTCLLCWLQPLPRAEDMIDVWRQYDVFADCDIRFKTSTADGLTDSVKALGIDAQGRFLYDHHNQQHAIASNELSIDWQRSQTRWVKGLVSATSE